MVSLVPGKEFSAKLNFYFLYLFICCRLARFLETAGSVLNYFEPFLGRIEIMGSSKRIERVYFEIKESNIEQWEKPQIKVLFLYTFFTLNYLLILKYRVKGNSSDTIFYSEYYLSPVGCPLITSSLVL